MMKKKLYISPEMETFKVKLDILMTGSLQGEAPEGVEGFAPGMSDIDDDVDW